MYNKTSLFGKLIVGAFTGMLLFTGVQTAHVYANNNGNTEYIFEFEGNYSDETARRIKMDSSAAWMSCENIEGPEDAGYLAYIYGHSNYTSNDGECFSSSNRFYEGTVRYMKNWAYESDKPVISIKATICGNTAASYNGYWSPDNGSGYY